MKSQPKDYEPPETLKDHMDYHDFAPWDEEPVKVWPRVLGWIVAIGFLCVLGFVLSEVY